MPRILLFLAAAWLCAFSSANGQIQLEVAFGISADGIPVEAADILMSRDGSLVGDFQKLPPDGKVKLQINSLSEKIGYVARSPGFAIASGEIPTNYAGQRIDVNLFRGITIQLSLDSDKSMPEGLLPMVCPEQFIQDVAFSMDARTSRGLLRMMEVIPLKSQRGVFQFQADPKSPVRVMVHEPGFLRGYLSEAIVPAPKIQVHLPVPVQVEATFAPTDLVDSEEALLILFRTFKEAKANVRMVNEHREGRVSGDWKDLAPGEYRAEGSAYKVETRKTRKEDVRLLSFAPGSSNTVTLLSAAIQSRFKGDAKAVVRVVDSAGKPVQDTLYEVFHVETNTFTSVSLATGKTDQAGTLLLADFKNGKDALRLTLRIRGLDLPFQLEREEKEQKINVTIPPASGDPVPAAEAMNLASGQNVTVASFKGRYLILDFWTTWCVPCQKPLADLTELQKKKQMAWSDKVAIFPISLDETKGEVLEHVKKNGLQTLAHAWDAPGNATAFNNSPAAKAFGVWAVPTSLIISPEGVILWRGNPWTINYELFLDSLLAGKYTEAEAIKWSQRERD